MKQSLAQLLTKEEHRQIPREYSGLEVYYLPRLQAYLKVGEIAMNSNLRWEREALMWLKGKIAVPELLDFEIVDEREYTLISEVEGEPCSDIAAGVDAEETEHLLEIIAIKMRKLHSIPITGCDLDQRLAAKLEQAQKNIRGGFVDESDFDTDNLGKTAGEILTELLTSVPESEDLVFTHGDFCLPNVIARGGAVAEFIDLDRAGVADRYQDIALFLRSFKFNAQPAFDPAAAFCRAYGIEKLDPQKLNFYRKLDELF
jgi:aminoglycoside phosphotransferase